MNVFCEFCNSQITEDNVVRVGNGLLGDERIILTVKFEDGSESAICAKCFNEIKERKGQAHEISRGIVEGIRSASTDDIIDIPAIL